MVMHLKAFCKSWAGFCCYLGIEFFSNYCCLASCHHASISTCFLSTLVVFKAVSDSVFFDSPKHTVEESLFKTLFSSTGQLCGFLIHFSILQPKCFILNGTGAFSNLKMKKFAFTPYSLMSYYSLVCLAFSLD